MVATGRISGSVRASIVTRLSGDYLKAVVFLNLTYSFGKLIGVTGSGFGSGRYRFITHSRLKTIEYEERRRVRSFGPEGISRELGYSELFGLIVL